MINKIGLGALHGKMLQDLGLLKIRGKGFFLLLAPAVGGGGKSIISFLTLWGQSLPILNLTLTKNRHQLYYFQFSLPATFYREVHLLLI